MKCLKCNRPLTFMSDKKKEYVYCKLCFAKLVQQGQQRCRCGLGFTRPCYFYNICGNSAMCCQVCQKGWIDKYCWPCR